MTDKQIIIDGVDVSECRFYSEKLSTMKGTGSISTIKCNGFCTHNIRGLDDSSCYDAHIEYAKCKNNNCYYKQLKAKEQECERLRFPMPDTNYAILTKEEFEQLDQLKAKNEELKNAYARLNSLYNDNCDYTDKLEKTITEIKETAEDFGFNGTYESYKTAIEQILQKINEAEDDR